MMGERQIRIRAVNLFVETGLLDEARRLRINLSETLERRLRTIVKAEQEKRWLAENQAALADRLNPRVVIEGQLQVNETRSSRRSTSCSPASDSRTPQRTTPEMQHGLRRGRGILPLR